MMATRTEIEEEKQRCDKCNSNKVIKIGKGRLKQRYYCRACMHWFFAKNTRQKRMAEILEKTGLLIPPVRYLY